jgi:hypothetical protein
LKLLHWVLLLAQEILIPHIKLLLVECLLFRACPTNRTIPLKLRSLLSRA